MMKTLTFKEMAQKEYNNQKEIADFIKIKWVKVDDIIKYCETNSFGYKDLGCNAINGDELIQEVRD